jgi:plastocyanin
METTNSRSKVRCRAVAGALVALLLVGCEPEVRVWCGTLAVHEEFVIPTASPVQQDFPEEARCVSLVSCGGTEHALVLDQDGRCIVQVDLSNPEQGVVRAGGQCESSRNRIGGPTRELGTATEGTVVLRGGQLDANIDWGVEILSSDISRVGATQQWKFSNSSESEDLGKLDPAEVCKPPVPPTRPEDFSAVVGCAPGDFAVRTEASAERVVRFGNALGAQYSPRCMTIEVGQSVTFEGPFSTYSMGPGIPESLSAGAPYNPITNVFGNQRVSFTFPRAGDFIFSNRPNAAQGMKGLIRVR